MARVVVNERKLASLAKQARAWPGSRKRMVSDAVVPGAAACVRGATGQVSLGMVARFPLHPKNPTFRKWGDYAGPESLAPWRDGIREWITLLARGIDPRVDQARRKAATLRVQASSFAALWTEYYDKQGSKLVKADEVRRAGLGFVKLWGERPAGDIEPVEIAAHIQGIARSTPGEARNRFGHLNRALGWAIGSGGFGVSVNPCRSLRLKDLVGAKTVRNRVLADTELRRLWGACDGPGDASAILEARRRGAQRDPRAPLGYPCGPLVKLLILTAQRLTEISALSWSEIDFDKRQIVIPAGRMKMDTAHIVPLAGAALALLASLPRFAGPYVFSVSDGATPVNGFSRIKERLDTLSGIEDWVLHDIRRTVRTHFSALPVQDLVRELVITHAKTGMHKIYDQFAYANEKRECLTLWEARLRGILAPMPPADVADLTAARERLRVRTVVPRF